MYDEAGKLKKMKHEQLKENEAGQVIYWNYSNKVVVNESLLGSWNERANLRHRRCHDDAYDVRRSLHLGDEQRLLEPLHRFGFLRTGWVTSNPRRNITY